MSKNKEIKGYCYSEKCNIITTGFNSNWYICRSCKEEVSERLAEEVRQREKDKKDKKDRKLSQDELDLAEMWSMTYGGKMPDGNDDGFY